MPQSSYTPIQHYRSTTPGAAPSAPNLTDGELGFNISDADMALYAKNASGTVKRVMNNPAGLKYPTADGSAANQVLKTDGAGNLAFLALTASRALVSDGTGGLGVSATTSTELGYVSGVTSAIQTQLNAKVAAVSSTDNAIVRFDGTGGAVQNSGCFIDDSGKLGIGTSSPGAKLDVRGISWFSADTYGRIEITPTTGDGGTAIIRQYTTSPRNGGDLKIQVDSSSQGGNLLFATGGSTERMRLDASGNLGLGVTPSAATTATIQLPSNTTISGGGTAASFAQNAIYNTSWKYISSAGSSLYQGYQGNHYWYTAPSGTAGNLITFTQAMTLDASGNLGVGTSSPAQKLALSASSANVGMRMSSSGGTGRDFDLISNTAGNLVIKSDLQSNILTVDGILGNLGLGVTPSAWSTGKAIEVGATGNGIWGDSGYTDLMQNVLYSAGAYRYVRSAAAARFDIENNTFRFLTAPSGTAGNPITFTQAMTLDASGNLHVPGGGGVATNEAFGTGALLSNTTGSYNTACGQASLYSNTTGSQNTACGLDALYSNTTADNNTAFGKSALYSNTTGTQNTACGMSALFSNTTGNYNTASGVDALTNNTTGSYNTASGRQALRNNTTGTYNTASGYRALRNTTEGTQNTACGQDSLYSNTTGNYNTASGANALYSNTTGNYNTASGINALTNSTTGYNNTAIGFGAGSDITTGFKNTIIGSYSGNQGGLDIRTASNYIVLSDGDGEPRQIIDASGNLGLGVTPSAWEVTAGRKAIEVGSVGNGLYGYEVSNFNISSNAYFNSGWKYASSGLAASYYKQSGGAHSWYTAPSGTAGNPITFTQAMTLDASGSLTVGATAVGQVAVFNSSNASGGYISIQNSGTPSILLGSALNLASGTLSDGAIRAQGNLVFTTNGGFERMRLDSSGNLGLGVTPSAWYSGIKAFELGALAAQWYTGGFFLAGVNVYTNTAGNFTYKTTNAATLYQQDILGRHAWFTAPSGTAGDPITFTQAMTLDASGKLLIGTSSPLFSVDSRLHVTNAGSVYTGIFNRSANGTMFLFTHSDSGGVGTISITTTGTAYNTTSDYRLKENVAPLTNALDTIAALKPCSFTWKADGSADRGFIAHELQEVIPQAVSGEKDAVDAEGNIMPQGVDYGKITPELVAAIQEQQAIINELKTRIEILENK